MFWFASGMGCGGCWFVCVFRLLLGFLLRVLVTYVVTCCFDWLWCWLISGAVIGCCGFVGFGGLLWLLFAWLASCWFD